MSKKDGLKISRRKALAGIGGIGVASAGAGLGTSAFYNDAADMEGNSITAGELDLRIDWQQLYDGPESNDPGHYEPYGEAGYPFVNAHPDHDTTGEQSLDSDEFSSVPDDGVVQYSDNSTNIQEYLTCETLENFDVPEDFDNGNRVQDSLIELTDLKPGDCGEVTFSYHLCDNPGYVWWLGELGDGVDEDLAKMIRVQAWYDVGCTNALEDGLEDRPSGGDQLIFSWGSLYDLLNGGGFQQELLDPRVYGSAVDPSEGGSSGGLGAIPDDCPDLGKIEWVEDYLGSGEGAFVPEAVNDEGSNPASTGDEFVGSGTNTSGYTYYDLTFDLDDDPNTTGDTVPMRITVTDWKDGGPSTGGDPIEVEIDLTEDTIDNYAVAGICTYSVKAGTTTERLFGQGNCNRNYLQRVTWTNDGDNTPGISNIDFDYCPLDAPDGPFCFPENETFCVSVKWCFPHEEIHLPDGVSMNELQGGSVSFDVGFYTEQCRHNADPSGPSGFT